MKKATALLLASFISLSALAATQGQPELTSVGSFIELKDGTKAAVLWQVGKQISYVSAAKVRTDGVTELEHGSVFMGERLLKKADGQCLNEQVRLVDMETVSVGNAPIQRPRTASVLMMSSFSALPGDGS